MNNTISSIKRTKQILSIQEYTNIYIPNCIQKYTMESYTTSKIISQSLRDEIQNALNTKLTAQDILDSSDSLQFQTN